MNGRVEPAFYPSHPGVVVPTGADFFRLSFIRVAERRQYAMPTRLPFSQLPFFGETNLYGGQQDRVCLSRTSEKMTQAAAPVASRLSKVST